MITHTSTLSIPEPLDEVLQQYTETLFLTRNKPLLQTL